MTVHVPVSVGTYILIQFELESSLTVGRAATVGPIEINLTRGGTITPLPSLCYADSRHANDADAVSCAVLCAAIRSLDTPVKSPVTSLQRVRHRRRTRTKPKMASAQASVLPKAIAPAKPTRAAPVTAPLRAHDVSLRSAVSLRPAHRIQKPMSRHIQTDPNTLPMVFPRPKG